MTKIEEISQRINEIGESFIESLNECQKALAELKESKKEGKWKPAVGEDFWHRDESGLIACCHFTEYNQYNRWMADNIPLFKTKEECERYWHFMDTVKEKSYEFSNDEWHTWGVKKYYIFYNYKNESIEVGDEYVTRDFDKTYFKEKSEAQYIIDNFKDELMEFFV